MAVLLAGAGASGAARSPLSPAQRAALLADYEPVLLFHPREDWAPSTVTAFLRRARVERHTARTTWAVQKGPLPTGTSGCALTPCYRLNLPCPLARGAACYEREAADVTDWSHPAVYGRVLDVPSGTPPPRGIEKPARYLIRYWLFYYFDDWRSLRDRLRQAHEADWETVSIGVGGDLRPLFAAYSAHCTGTVRRWSDVRVRGTHPVDYVALGSHANYFDEKPHSTEFSRCLRRYRGARAAERLVRLAQDRLVDRTGTAHAVMPDRLDVVELSKPLPRWARFPGRWSEGQLLWLGRTPRRLTRVSQGAGPATPSWSGTTIPSLWHDASS